ncbi:Transcriptional regulator, AcrR family [Olavius algarvensis Delta 1 endosymbiont]|nr:Transcriptional regulator, AcrR family [Olavius algarvensis Delta 1 endosymbiont]
MRNTNEISVQENNSRERLLETATGLFAEKGYAGTSVREIVEKAGVSKPVLYYYFKSKEGLFYAILDWAAEVQRNILNEIFEARGTVLERFIFLYRRVQEGIQQYKSLYIVIHGLVYGPPEGVPEYDFASFQRRMLDAVKRIYTEGLSSGELRKVDAEEVAFIVVGLMDFSLNMDRVLPELADPQRPERLLQLAFQGLSRQ